MKENNKGTMEALGDYMKDIFDKDKDGIVTAKEIFTVFPNSAIAIAVLFVDILVAIAEYRVWDFGMHVTGDPWKAFGFVLISAIPFYLGQILWLYPLGTFFQKSIAVAFVGAALYTSWTFGTADLTLQYDIKMTARYLQDLTVSYIVGTLLYIVIDPTIKAMRMKTQAQRKAAWQGELNKIANSILASLRGTLAEKRSIESEFGEDEVAKAMAVLNGGKQKTKQLAATTSRVSTADVDLAKQINPLAAPYRACPDCGEVVPLTSKFCANCGTGMPPLPIIEPVNNGHKPGF